MDKLKKFLRSPAVTAVLFLLAAAMLTTGTIGGTRAALTYFSEVYSSRVEMYDIGISLLENGARLSWRDYGKSADGTWDEYKGYLFGGRYSEDEGWPVGVACSEELAVHNSGSIDEYVRVNIYKYWVDGSGNKLRDLDPAYIEITLANLGNGWIWDGESSTTERTVLYYDRILAAGETTPVFTSALTVSAPVEATVTEERVRHGSYTEIYYTYDYDGVTFQIEVEAEAVQTHNGEDAIHSAWGPQVSLEGDRLRLLTEGQNPQPERPQPVEPQPQPVEPQPQPEEPQQQPEEPEQQPEEPEQQPEEPEQQPEEPEQQPEEPEQQPEEPEQQPKEPEKQPKEPEKQPNEPQQQPKEPEQQPKEPEPQPEEPEQQPDEEDMQTEGRK